MLSARVKITETTNSSSLIDCLHLGFYAVWWMFVPTFRRIVLPPYSRWLNLVQVDAGVVGNKWMCVLYGKVGGNVANQISWRGGRIELALRQWECVWRTALLRANSGKCAGGQEILATYPVTFPINRHIHLFQATSASTWTRFKSPWRWMW